MGHFSKGASTSVYTLLYTHQALLAATVFAAAHDGATIYRVRFELAWGRGWVVAFPAVLNGLLWFGWTSGLVRSRPWAGVRAQSLLFVIPGVFFAAIAVVNQVRTDAPPEIWLPEAIAFALTFVVAAAVFAASWDARPFFRGLGAAGAAICLEGMVQLFQRAHNPDSLFDVSRLRASGERADMMARLGSESLPYPTMLASLLVVFASVALGLATTAQRSVERGLWAAVFCLNALAIYLTSSRAGLVFLALVMLAHFARRGIGWLAAGLAGGCLLSAILVWLLRKPGSLLRGDGSLRSRFHMWRVCLRIARQYPLFGGGPDAFRDAWPAYAAPFGYPDYAVPHSLYFSLLAEGGIVMLTMAQLLILGAAREVWKLMRSPAPPITKSLLFSLAVAIAAVLGHDVIETSFRMRSMYVLALVFAALIVGMRSRLAAMDEHARVEWPEAALEPR